MANLTLDDIFSERDAAEQLDIHFQDLALHRHSGVIEPFMIESTPVYTRALLAKYWAVVSQYGRLSALRREELAGMGVIPVQMDKEEVAQIYTNDDLFRLLEVSNARTLRTRLFREKNRGNELPRKKVGKRPVCLKSDVEAFLLRREARHDREEVGFKLKAWRQIVKRPSAPKGENNDNST